MRNKWAKALKLQQDASNKDLRDCITCAVGVLVMATVLLIVCG